jgi:hypothetical protein
MLPPPPPPPLLLLLLLLLQGAGAPQDHFIIPPIFLGFADAYVYLRDNKQFEDEVHKILAKTVSPWERYCV